ncbi:adhesin [Pseudomonas frederiksbergensis]|nr:adhesin [Pseudomonas frederiksbergensis]
MASPAPIAMLSLQYMEVFMANDASTTINIRADIPTKQFHAQPLDPNFGRDEVMTYNTVAGELSQLSTTFALKNTGGSIDEYLQDGPAALTNGVDAIPLTVTLGGVTLDGTPKEVAADAESGPGLQRVLTISAAKPSATQVGLYSATPVVIFDAIPRI